MRVDIVAVAGGLFSSTVVVVVSREGSRSTRRRGASSSTFPLTRVIACCPILQEGAFRTNTAAVDLALNIRPGIFSASFSTDASQPFTPLETPVNPPLEVTFEVPPDEDSGFSSESSDSEGGARGGTHFGREVLDDGGQQLADSSDTSQGASSESTASLSKAMAAGEIREYSRDFGSPTEGGGGLSGDGDPLSL